MDQEKCPVCGGRLNDVNFGEWFCMDCFRSFRWGRDGPKQVYLRKDGNLYEIDLDHPATGKAHLADEVKPKKKRGRPKKANPAWVTEKEAMRWFHLTQEDLTEGLRLGFIHTKAFDDETRYQKESLSQFVTLRELDQLRPSIMRIMEACTHLGMYYRTLFDYVTSRGLFYKRVGGACFVDVEEIQRAKEEEHQEKERVKDLLTLNKASAKFHHSPKVLKEILEAQQIDTIKTKWAEYIPEEGRAFLESIH